MNTHARTVSTGYGIVVEDIPGRVTARIGDIVLASSTRAKVMYETRLSPAVYFPPENIIADFSAPTSLQTFCPFKGTATYRDITLPDRTLSNAAWTYQKALPESREIEGYFGFMPTAGVEIEAEDSDLAMPNYGNVSGPLVDWLLRAAWACKTPEELTEALAEKLLENGVAVSRLSILIWSLHPLIAGKNYIWKKGEEGVATFAPSYEIYDHPGFVNSPLLHVSRGLGGVRQKIGVEYDDNAFPIIEDLRSQGATDYVAMPLPFSDGQTNVMTITSDHPDGFTTANLGLIFECSAIISRFYEVFNQRTNSMALLETYVGTRAGGRVLGGEIRRGDGEEIDAAIMFCDMRASTRLETDLGREAFLDLLNQFFETIATRVEEHGGEVLKFIGDAVLAIFPAGDDPVAARRNAVKAGCDIVEGLNQINQSTEGLDCRCVMGIAYGNVMYGNVGSQARLDFTVIGSAANIAARLGDHGKTQGHKIVVTQDIAVEAPSAIPLGRLELHNVAEPVEGYAIDASCQTSTA
ncbi:MAG: DUF427 domain-containing protein [Paracoccaceae bacterium]